MSTSNVKFIRTSVLAAAAALIALAGPQAASAATSSLEPIGDAGIREHTPDQNNGGSNDMETRSRPNADSGRQNLAFVRFDLTGVSNVTDAEFSFAYRRGHSNISGLLAYGLNDVAGNTPQTWAESSITYNTTGAEIPGDGDPTTQDLGSTGNTGAENLWALGETSGCSGCAVGQYVTLGGLSDGTDNTELIAFLNSRAGGFATIILADTAGGEHEGIWMTSDRDDTAQWPQLYIEADAIADVSSADFDSSGLVVGADFLRLQQNLGLAEDFLVRKDGDANGDNVVDSLDMEAWQAQYGTAGGVTSSVPAGFAVPEPTAAILSIAGLIGLGIAARRRG